MIRKHGKHSVIIERKEITYENNTDYHGSGDWFQIWNRNQTAGKDVGQWGDHHGLLDL